jgi:hypothetical protein
MSRTSYRLGDAGVGAAADWAHGEHSANLTYQQIECDPWVWWGWLNPVVGILSRLFSK